MLSLLLLFPLFSVVFLFCLSCFHLFTFIFFYFFFLLFFFFFFFFFFFSSRRRHTRWTGDWSSDVCSSDLTEGELMLQPRLVGLDVLAREARLKHEFAFRAVTDADTELAVGGGYHFRVNGEYHLLNPETISKLQHSVRDQNCKTFQEYTELIDNQSHNLATLRSFMKC